MTSTQIIAIVIFLVTMAAIMTEKLHRTVAAVAGALLLILTGVLSVESGFSYVDLNTLGGPDRHDAFRGRGQKLRHL